jgi:hypothetical protein
LKPPGGEELAEQLERLGGRAVQRRGRRAEVGEERLGRLLRVEA